MSDNKENIDNKFYICKYDRAFKLVNNFPYSLLLVKK